MLLSMEWVKQFKERLKETPISIFYQFLWTHDKTLLAKSLAVNYILPVMLEILPLTSRNQLLISLRKTKVGITLGLQTDQGLDRRLLHKFLMLSLIHIVLDTLITSWKNQINAEHKFAIRRLVLQRILHSEIHAFHGLKEKTAERFLHVGQSLAFLHFTVPDIIATFYALYLHGAELWKHRKDIHLLALIYPIVFYLLNRAVTWFRTKLVAEADEKVKKKRKKERDRKTVEFVSNLLDGLDDIQVNNLQPSQLQRLDTLIGEELARGNAIPNLLDGFLERTVTHNVFLFVTEAYVINAILQQKNIDFKDYILVKEDISHALEAVQKLISLWTVSKNVLDAQEKISDLVKIPNWLGETNRATFQEFQELRIKGIQFSYEHGTYPAVCFSPDTEMIFERGKTYGIFGQNMCGKSTLTHIICRLYDPTQGTITINGIPYSTIGRKYLREQISYASQTPFLFPGTIRDNIKIGNPYASEEAVEEAAVAAGVMAFVQSPRTSPTRGRRVPALDMKRLEERIRATFQQNEIRTQSSEPDEHSQSRDPTRLYKSANFRASSDEVIRHLPKPNPNVLQRRASERSFTCDKEAVRAMLDKDVTARGSNISGGLAQSVALARVFVRTKARLVIIDESLEQMDSWKKRKIIFPQLFDYIEKHDMTLILVSHDMSIAKSLDYIYVMDGGNVVHQGTHKQLIEAKAPVYLQLLGEDTIL